MIEGLPLHEGRSVGFELGTSLAGNDGTLLWDGTELSDALGLPEGFSEGAFVEEGNVLKDTDGTILGTVDGDELIDGLSLGMLVCCVGGELERISMVAVGTGVVWRSKMFCTG